MNLPVVPGKKLEVVEIPWLSAPQECDYQSASSSSNSTRSLDLFSAALIMCFTTTTNED